MSCEDTDAAVARQTGTIAREAELLTDFSLEMTGKDVPGLSQARATIPPGTRINITFLGGEDLAMRVAAAAAVKEHGFTPVPHISARRIGSRAALEEFLSALQARVTHADTTADLQRRGADVERAVLSRAVKWHSEDRVIRHGKHTIVFA